MTQPSGSASDRPLFQGMDEKERELAPEQVPGAERPRLDERGEQGAEQMPFDGAVAAVPAGGVSGAGVAPMPTGGIGGAAVTPLPPQQERQDREDEEQQGEQT